MSLLSSAMSAGIGLVSKASPEAIAKWAPLVAGEALPIIVDSMRRGRTPEEAAQFLAPKRQEMVERLIGAGLDKSKAEAIADASLQSDMAEAQKKQPMGAIGATALGLGGAFVGNKIGGALSSRIAAKNQAKTVAASVPADPQTQSSTNANQTAKATPGDEGGESAMGNDNSGAVGGVAMGALTGAGLGAEIGSVVPVVGTAIGAGVGAVGGGLIGALTGRRRGLPPKTIDTTAEIVRPFPRVGGPSGHDMRGFMNPPSDSPAWDALNRPYPGR